MYHPINRPDCEEQLRKLNNLARLTIAFGLENTANIAQNHQGHSSPQQNLARQLGNEFLAQHGGSQFLAGVQTRFIQYIEAHVSRRAGQWLWDKYAAIAEPVVRILVIPLAEKQGILEAFDADQKLEERFAEGFFHYTSIPTSSANALEHVKKILYNFYTVILAQGIPADVLGEQDDLTRQTVLRSYLNANRRLKVCPGCDGSPPSIADGIVHEDIDHIFPKSKYPFLTVHCINLTPFCKHCNQTYKRDKDALDALGVTGLSDIYHPYLRPAKGEISVVVKRDPADGEPHLHLRANPNDQQHTARLSSLNHLLDLEARWEGDLREERLREKLSIALLHASGDDRRAEFAPSEAAFPKWFQQKMSTIIDDMRLSIGKAEGEVPSAAYARWVASDAQAAAEWIDIVRDALFRSSM